VGSGSHAEQTARIMMAFEPVCLEHRPDWAIVVGDVNSTIACALTARKLGIRVAHVEAGLRSRDMSMPEEINRLCTDAISDLLFTTDTNADENLRNEGIVEEKIHFVGNTMIDTLCQQIGRARELPLPDGLSAGEYAVLTLHRPANVDSPERLASIMGAINVIADRIPVVFPVHPRTAPQAARHWTTLPCPHRRAHELSPVSRPGCPLPHGSHRQRRHPGGDDGVRSAVPHHAPQHRTPDHL
jgi:UDP-N-acetylglucosamine 2-epimerase (non-hydrolysing)